MYLVTLCTALVTITTLGLAMRHVGSHRFLIAGAGFNPRPLNFGFVVDIPALGPVCFLVLQFPNVSSMSPPSLTCVTDILAIACSWNLNNAFTASAGRHVIAACGLLQVPGHKLCPLKCAQVPSVHLAVVTSHQIPHLPALPPVLLVQMVFNMKLASEVPFREV